MHTDVKQLFERQQFGFIGGPCVIESLECCQQVASFLRDLTASHQHCGFVFKASFDKANRTSLSAFRGPGLDIGMEVLASIKSMFSIPVITDIHTPEQAEIAAQTVDVLQIPAFLCRQTDLLVAAAQTGLPTNIKKGQFLAPQDVVFAVNKHQQSGGGPVAVTERGTTFGYNNLVVDMRSLVWMREETNAAIIFDATHAVQRPGSTGGATGGDSHLAPALARAAAAVGIDGLFCEVHPNPQSAKSDGPNSLNFEQIETTLNEVLAIRATLPNSCSTPYDQSNKRLAS